MIQNLTEHLNSVGVVIVDESHNFLLQKRDKKNSIYFPGLWGLFGGACEPGELPKNAVIREIEEELSIRIEEFDLFLSLNIESRSLGSGLRTRFFYSAEISDSAKNKIHLREGSKFKFFDKKSLPSIAEVVPFDLSALIYYHHLKIKPRVIKPII